MLLSTLIVDDDPLAVADLSYQLSFHSNIRVTDIAGSLSEARTVLSEKTYDLVFLDMQLGNNSGFDLVASIDPNAKIIFTTEDGQFAARTFEVNALDYLNKPVSSERLAKTLERLVPKRKDEDNPKNSPSTQIRINSHMQPISPEDLLVVASIGGNYLKLILKNNTKVVCRETLKHLESLLPTSTFARIHRSIIVNTEYIENIVEQQNRTCLVYLKGLEPTFQASRRKATRLKQIHCAQQKKMKECNDNRS